jgi:DNA-binding transcriptional MerR regulator
MREQLHIGEVARLLGISTKTIRYYHQVGLLAEPERTESGYRLYDAAHLLRLQRIRRLRALGLSLERIRAILEQEPQDHEKTLRAALHSLVEELSAQILELEERRSFLQELLAGENLELEDREAYLFYSPELKERLLPHLAHLSAEALEWGQRIDAMLGSFNWPDEYRQSFQRSLQHVADHADHYRQLFALEERLARLANLPEDAPEVEQLAEEYARSEELLLLFRQLEQSGLGEENQFSATLAGLMANVASPALRRFFELLASKAAPQQSHRPSLPTKSEQEQ